MRSAIFVCTLVVLACICLQAEAFKASCETCPDFKRFADQCLKIKCNEDGSGTVFGCSPLFMCPGATKFIDTDLSKPYPDCCAQTICTQFLVPDVLESCTLL